MAKHFNSFECESNLSCKQPIFLQIKVDELEPERMDGGWSYSHAYATDLGVTMKKGEENSVYVRVSLPKN